MQCNLERLVGIGLLLLMLPTLAMAQNQSPFLTGATSLESNILAWMTPIAIILVMVLGAMAMANRISWGWCIAAILGIAIVFGAPQIVAWVQSMFGV
jgi:type IV secretory pathway VirB2 component (pilin)